MLSQAGLLGNRVSMRQQLDWYRAAVCCGWLCGPRDHTRYQKQSLHGVNYCDQLSILNNTRHLHEMMSRQWMEKFIWSSLNSSSMAVRVTFSERAHRNCLAMEGPVKKTWKVMIGWTFCLWPSMEANQTASLPVWRVGNSASLDNWYRNWHLTHLPVLSYSVSQCLNKIQTLCCYDSIVSNNKTSQE